MRKGKCKSVRGEKCQSGDSGIGVEDHTHVHRNLATATPTPSALASSRNNRMSLVEIPNHVWDKGGNKEREVIARDQDHTPSAQFKREAEEDDGFSSGEESSSRYYYYF